MANQDMFDAPIPGQSLTRAPGSRPYEQPPRWADPEDATVGMLKSISGPKQAAAIAIALEKGIPATTLARGILQGGITFGNWSPDVALLIGKRTLAGVVAIGTRAGADPKKIKYAEEKEDPLMKLVMSKDFLSGGAAEDTLSDTTRGATKEELTPEKPRPGFDEEIDSPLPPEGEPMSVGLEEENTSGLGGVMAPLSRKPERPSLKDADITPNLMKGY